MKKGQPEEGRREKDGLERARKKRRRKEMVVL